MPQLELVTQVIAGTAKGPRVLISAGVHGDEYEPMMAVRTLMATVKPEDIHGTLTLVPVVNVAAFTRGERTAEDALDLARVCPGNPAGSITHQAAAALSNLIRAADFYMDLHTGGKALTLVPLAGYTLHRDPAVLAMQRRMARAFNLPFIWGTTPNLDGRSLSVARDHNVPAIYVEHGGGTELNINAVAQLVDGCWNVMAEVGMAKTRPAGPSRVTHVVEDPREQSGHLQINYPCPRNGIFEPSLQAGDMVEAGGLIGRVLDPMTGESTDVRALESGMLVMLRAMPLVRTGDPLAAIVDVSRNSHAG